MKIIHLPLLPLIALSLLPAPANAVDTTVTTTDHSLTVKEYVDKGVPAPDKIWQPADYEAAAAVLKSIAQTDPTQLPRFGSPASGKLFEHFISDDNLSYFLDTTVPVDQRIVKLAAVGSYTPLLLVYANVSTPDHNFDAEIVELGAFILRVEVDGSVVMKQFLVAHPEVVNNPQVVEGFKTARGGFSQSVNGIIDIMLDFANTHPPEALRCAAHLKTILPELLPELLLGDRDKIVARLTAAAGSATNPDIKTALNDLVSVSSPAK